MHRILTTKLTFIAKLACRPARPTWSSSHTRNTARCYTRECAKPAEKKEREHLGEIAIRKGVQAAVGAHVALLAHRDAHG